MSTEVGQIVDVTAKALQAADRQGAERNVLNEMSLDERTVRGQKACQAV